MRSFIALPAFASLLALATAAELPLTPVATPPAVRPTPGTFTPSQVPPGAPIGQRPAFPATNTATSQQTAKPSVFVLTKVPASPTGTGTPTNPDKCSQVAARITPQLTPKPTYAPSLKAMADKMGGVERDTCGEMDFTARFKSYGPENLNRFQQTRHTTFILPIWAKVSELYNACGEQAAKMRQVAEEPCYRWALDLTKSSNSSLGNGVKGQPSSGKQGGNIKTADLEAGSAQSSISNAAVVGVVGVLTLLWTVVLA